VMNSPWWLMRGAAKQLDEKTHKNSKILRGIALLQN
jgi:hypothetical protein